MSNTVELEKGTDMVLALARAGTYNLLATVYAEAPSRGLTGAIRDRSISRALQTWGMSSHAVDEYACGRDSHELAEELDVEYTRLFVGPGPGYVGPYASLHGGDSDNLGSGGRGPSGKGQLWGKEAIAARQFYLDAGLAVDDRFAHIPDHLGLELQFMHHLCSREARACAESRFREAKQLRASQRIFLRDHLLSWLPAFVAAVFETTAHPLYRTIAELTLRVVRADLDQLAGEGAARPEASLC